MKNCKMQTKSCLNNIMKNKFVCISKLCCDINFCVLAKCNVIQKLHYFGTLEQSSHM